MSKYEQYKTLRNEGKTYKQIGEIFGISTQGVQNLIRYHEDDEFKKQVNLKTKIRARNKYSNDPEFRKKQLDYIKKWRQKNTIPNPKSLDLLVGTLNEIVNLDCKCMSKLIDFKVVFDPAITESLRVLLGKEKSSYKLDLLSVLNLYAEKQSKGQRKIEAVFNTDGTLSGFTLV